MNEDHIALDVMLTSAMRIFTNSADTEQTVHTREVY